MRSEGWRESFRDSVDGSEAPVGGAGGAVWMVVVEEWEVEEMGVLLGGGLVVEVEGG